MEDTSNVKRIENSQHKKVFFNTLIIGILVLVINFIDLQE
jgi:hypothetical protein